MAVNFPNTPVIGQEYTFAGNTWLYNGRGWVQNPKPIVSTSRNPNLVINGNFDVWQRAITGTLSSNYASGMYVADRFLSAADASSTGSFTVSQQAFTLGQTEVPDSPKYFLRFATTSFTNSTNGFTYLLGHKIEDVTKFSGKTVTLSFWAKASTATSLRITCTQVFGTSGSAAVITVAGSPALTTAFQKITLTVNLPSIAGKIIGAGSYLYIEIFGGILGTTATSYGVSPLTVLSTGSYDFSQIKLEEGSVATAVGVTNYAEEERKCFRYCPVVGGTAYIGSGFSTNATLGYCSINHIVTPRVPPTGIILSGGFSVVNAAGATVNLTSVSFNAGFLLASILTISAASGLTPQAPLFFYSNGGKLIFNGCEL